MGSCLGVPNNARESFITPIDMRFVLVRVEYRVGYEFCTVAGPPSPVTPVVHTQGNVVLLTVGITLARPDVGKCKCDITRAVTALTSSGMSAIVNKLLLYQVHMYNSPS